MPLGEGLRVALSWSGTSTPTRLSNSAGSPAWATPSASNIAAGLSYRLSESISTGFSLGTLNEKHSLLGSTYESGSALSLGDTNRSTSYSFSTGWLIDEQRSLLVEAGFANTRASTADGLFAGTSAIQSRSWGATFQQVDWLQKHDRLSFSVRQPLRVTSGSVAMVNTDIDSDGVAHYSTEWSSLVPDGHETDLKLGYQMPAGKSASWAFEAGYRKDVLNVKGSKDANIGAMWRSMF